MTINDEWLRALNKEQLKAVTTLKGPILIVAGAGSGKTRVITNRIAYILKAKPDIKCENILALTFSRKAAEEMRERARNLIDSDPADITLSTFHAFCHSIIRDHALDLGLGGRSRLIDKTEQKILLKRSLSKLKLDYYSNVTDYDQLAEGLLKFISRLKDELVSEDDYDRYLRKIRNKEEKKKYSEVLAAHRLYRDACRRMGYLDFGDLIAETITLFKKRPHILNSLRERFKYILVDEFQDTNVAQIELVSMLGRPHGNICVVGDDDQAIYRFRGASYASFTKFKEYFPNHIKIKLSENYRSTKKILRTADNLIKANNIDRYDPEKRLWTKRREGPKIEVMVARDYAEEATWVLSKIKEIHADKSDISEVAVLYRAHSYKEELAKLLKLENIPYVIIGGIGLFESEEVKEAIAYLRLMTDRSDNASCYKLLSSIDYGIRDEDISSIARYSRYENLDLYSALQDTSKIGIRESSREAVAAFLAKVKNLKRQAAREPAKEFFYDLITQRTSILKRAFLSQETGGAPAMRNLNKLYRLIVSYADSRQGNRLSDLVEYLNTYIDSGEKMENEFDNENTYGVKLMTVHQAKGLEFSHVFVISLVQNRFPSSAKSEPIPFPEALIKEQLPRGNFHIEEERRLFYVALTRAKDRLFLSGVKKKYTRPSVFLEEILETDEGSGNTRLTTPQDAEIMTCVNGIPLSGFEAAKIGAFRKLAKIAADLGEEDLEGTGLNKKSESMKSEIETMFNSLRTIKEKKKSIVSIPHHLLERFKSDNVYSFTQIETYISCPLQYKFTYINSVPRRPKPYFSLGSVVHESLREFYTRVQQGVDVNLEELMAIYDKQWVSSGYRSKKEEKAYKTRGKNELAAFYRKNKDDLKPPMYLEKKFTLELGGRPFKGFIDRIDEMENGKAEIIDYKTGKTERKSTIQLDLYAIAAIEKLGLEVGKLSFYYLTSNKKVSHVRTYENLDDTKCRIEEIIRSIEDGRFEPSPSYRCKFCDFKILCPAFSQ